MSRRLPRVGSLAAAVAALALGAAPAVAQQCGMPYREVVSAMYAQVLESGGHPANLDYWEWQMQNGVTVRQMVHDHAQWGLDGQPLLTAQSDSMKLTYLYRHILAREPDDHAWGWIGVGQVHGWHHVVSGLVNSAEYSSRFGDYIVPGSPVTAWDCARAAGITAVAHAHDYVDATMGAANLGYTTPAYVSLDQPRSLTFAYSSGTARPQGLVRVNVFDPHAPPERISIQLYETDGTQITGETFYQGGPGVTQVSSHFDADAKYSAAWSVRVAIRRYYASNPTPVEAVFDTRVSIVNERDSPFGRGWTLAGYPRLRNQGDGVFITESGLGAWFWLQGSDPNGDRRYASPQGDFSKVAWHQASGTYRRRYPDGTVVRFGWDGLVLDVTDRHGNLIAYSHNGSQLTKVVDPVGKTTTLGYNGAGALAWVEDPMGRRSNTTTNGNVVWQWWQPDGSWALDMHFVDGGARSPVLDSYWTPGGSRDEGLHTAWSFSYDAHGRAACLRRTPRLRASPRTSAKGIVRSTPLPRWRTVSPFHS